MTWEKPLFSRSQVDKAGEYLASLPRLDAVPNKIVWAVKVLNNWRACHALPIATFHATLKVKIKNIDPDALIAQRLKRAPSIINKLMRPDRTQLSRMQDIGGLRAVVSQLDEVYQLLENYKTSRFKHELCRTYDYIENPKLSGYRSLHLVYKYHSEHPTTKIYNGMRLEIQIRTRIQHAWATAVETMALFLKESLKASEGPEEWLEFFALSGSAFAHLEDTKPSQLHAHLSKMQVYEKVADTSRRLNVKMKLEAFSIAANSIHINEDQKGSYHLIKLDIENKTVSVKSFSRDRLAEANESYAAIEEQIKLGDQLQVVLVSTSSVAQLRESYPSYFLDTVRFLQLLQDIEIRILSNQ
jgi:ppGpp synthetase/RelA/SpoT-type nucleotidyltranferase